MFRRLTAQPTGCPHQLLHLFLLLTLLLVTMNVTGQNGFLGDIPSTPYDAAYDIYFRNYPAVRPCIMTAALMVTNDTLGKTKESLAYMGCIIGTNVVNSHAFILLSVAEAAQASIGGCDGNTTSLQEVLRGLILPVPLSTSGIGLVLSTRDENTTADIGCDMTCFLAAVQRYNAIPRKEDYSNMPNITLVVFSDNAKRYWFSGDRRSGEGLGLPREVTSAYDFLVLYLPAALDGDWVELMKVAAFNRARWSMGHIYPQSVLETRNGMALAGSLSPSSLTPSHSCVEDSSPSCAPLGGWTVWASTANINWRWNKVSSTFVKTTKKGAIALLVASTTVSLLHSATPGADCPASAIVATLSVLEAYKRLGDDSREVYAFFFPGEHVGSVGSARFMSDATVLECARAGLSNCTALAYKDNLNFTTVNFSAIDTFIVVDQVAYHDAPLYYHVDSRVKPGLAQEKAEAVMKSDGVHQAATSRLPYSPITTLLDLIPDAAIGDKVLLTLTRYNTTYTDPNVFTVFDTVTKRSALSAASVAEAADVMLRVLLASHVSSFSSSSSSVKVNHSVVELLWECFTVNLHCNFLNIPEAAAKDYKANDVVMDNNVMAPDFSVSSMVGDYITHTQLAIEKSLQRLGWTNISRSPAVPKSLRIPHDKWGLQWKLDETWIRQHNSSRYTLYVMSLWHENIGARSTFIGSEGLSLTFLLMSIVVSGFTLVGLRACFKKK